MNSKYYILLIAIITFLCAGCNKSLDIQGYFYVEGVAHNKNNQPYINKQVSARATIGLRLSSKPCGGTHTDSTGYFKFICTSFGKGKYRLNDDELIIKGTPPLQQTINLGTIKID